MVFPVGRGVDPHIAGVQESLADRFDVESLGSLLNEAIAASVNEANP
jgi:hypothetical protein